MKAQLTVTLVEIIWPMGLQKYYSHSFCILQIFVMDWSLSHSRHRTTTSVAEMSLSVDLLKRHLSVCLHSSDL